MSNSSNCGMEEKEPLKTKEEGDDIMRPFSTKIMKQHIPPLSHTSSFSPDHSPSKEFSRLFLSISKCLRKLILIHLDENYLGTLLPLGGIYREAYLDQFEVDCSTARQWKRLKPIAKKFVFRNCKKLIIPALDPELPYEVSFPVLKHVRTRLKFPIRDFTHRTVEIISFNVESDDMIKFREASVKRRHLHKFDNLSLFEFREKEDQTVLTNQKGLSLLEVDPKTKNLIIWDFGLLEKYEKLRKMFIFDLKPFNGSRVLDLRGLNLHMFKDLDVSDVCNLEIWARRIVHYEQLLARFPGLRRLTLYTDEAVDVSKVETRAVLQVVTHSISDIIPNLNM